jgi:hypothetical protein
MRGTALLLTLRAAGLRAHRAQWALPGGRCDEGETPAHGGAARASRRTRLELGGRRAGFARRLSDALRLSDHAGGGVGADQRGHLAQPGEVASVHRIALDDIEHADAFRLHAIPESTRRVIRFRHAGQFIHAPTAALIYQFREVLAGRYPRRRTGTAGIRLEVTVIEFGAVIASQTKAKLFNENWIASSALLLAMTRNRGCPEVGRRVYRRRCEETKRKSGSASNASGKHCLAPPSWCRAGWRIRAAQAQTYPNRAITLVIPFAPGGSTSIVGRASPTR